MEIVYNMRMRIEKVIQDLEDARCLVDYISNKGEVNRRLKRELVERINRVIIILLSDEDLLNELEVCENKLDVLRILERDGIVESNYEIKNEKLKTKTWNADDAD